MLGENSYGKSVDVWAAGFIMFEMIAGRHPLYVRHLLNRGRLKEKISRATRRN